MTETSDGAPGKDGAGDLPIEHQHEPLMAGDGVYEGVTIIGGGSEPGPDLSKPGDGAEPRRKRPVDPNRVRKLAFGGGGFLVILIILTVLAVAAGRGNGSDGETQDARVEASEGAGTAKEDADPAADEPDENATQNDGGEATPPAVAEESVSFATDDIGGFQAVTADEALAARTEGTLIQASAEADPEGSVTIDEVTVEVEDRVVTGTFEVAEASGPFGVGFTIATPAGAVVASHIVQGMAEGDPIQTVGTTTIVNSTGFADGGEELTQVVSTEIQEPTPLGADRTITIRWDLKSIVVPQSWGPLSFSELQLLAIIDGAPFETDSAELIAFRRATFIVALLGLDPTLVFVGDGSVQAETIPEQRVNGFVRAGLPQETAACLAEDIPLRTEILVSFRPALQEPLLIQCLLLTQFFSSVAAQGLQNYVFDGTLDIGCLAEGLAVHIPDVATYLVFAGSDHTQWPPGLIDKYAAVLEVCVPLEAFYLAQFGQYNFTDPDCPVTMTNHVLLVYSWLLFIVEGILSLDPTVQSLAHERFNDHINKGYGKHVCVVLG